MNKEMTNKLNSEFSDQPVQEILKFLESEHKNKVVFTTSFGYEDQVITDIICRNNIDIKLVTLDTGRLFEETYKTYRSTVEKYGRPIIPYFPRADQVEKMMTEKGPFSFYDSIDNRKECCNIRKVIPLGRALSGMEVWITGLRAQQSAIRSGLSLFEWDENYNLLKYNPLLNWTFETVKEYIKDNQVPYNILHDKGFVSIGCAPCTRAISPGEDFKAGRWWWEQNSGKECGIHRH